MSVEPRVVIFERGLDALVGELDDELDLEVVEVLGVAEVILLDWSRNVVTCSATGTT